MGLTNEIVKAKLTEKFGDDLLNWEEPYGLLTFEVPKDLNLKVMQFLHEDETLGFTFLTDITGIHYPDKKGSELGVIYHLQNLPAGLRVRMKVFTDINSPDIYTATSLFPGANWMERETFDFYGINFVGHTDLRRILNVDEMDYFPLRKEYPLEDQSRIDKDDEMFGRGGSYN
jgi:NADH-quinone oxidoreductase subunit C